MTGPLGRARELRALVTELAPEAWRGDPAWWALVGTAALVEPLGRRARARYLVSNAEPSHDTFMGAAQPGPASAADWVAWAVTMAHAAVDAIAAHDGALPDQPLAVTVEIEAGLARLRPVADRWRVGFAIGARVEVGRLDPRGAGHDGALVRALTRALRGQPSGLTTPGPRPAVVVTIGDDELARAHHGHRRAWRADGGPWLGVARADGLTVVSTCHLVVDGFGHALLARAIVDAAVAPAVQSAAVAAIGRADEPGASPGRRAPPLPPTAGEALDVAWRRRPPVPSFPALAYALGRVLHRVRGDGTAARSPSFQLPVAPGAADDPGRFAHRVRPALLSVRFSDGQPEPFAAFAARAKRVVAREAAGGGLAARLLGSLAAIPVPTGWKHRSLTRAPSRWLAGPTELLCGDSCLSLLRLDGGAALIAASAPPPQVPRTRAASVVTVVRDATGATVTLAATGPIPAAELLDQWLALVDAPG